MVNRGKHRNRRLIAVMMAEHRIDRHEFGSRIVPDEDAVNLTEAARAQQGIPYGETVTAAADKKQKS